MKSKRVWGLIVVMSMAMGIIVYSQSRQKRELKSQLLEKDKEQKVKAERLVAERVVQNKKLSKIKAKLSLKDRKIEILEKRLRDKEDELRFIADGKTAAADKSVNEVAGRSEKSANPSEMSPEMKKYKMASDMAKNFKEEMKPSMAMATKMQLERLWGDFFKKIEPALRGDFVDFMVNSQMESFLSAAKIPDELWSDEEKFKDYMRNYKLEYKKNLADGIKNILGADAFSDYKEYKKTMTARAHFDGMTMMGFVPANSAQKEELLEMMIEVNYDNALPDEEKVDPVKAKENREKVFSEYKDHARKILDDESYKRFLNTLNSYKKLMSQYQ